MAIFNPNPQEVQEQDFRSFSRPNSPIEGSKAAGVALTGAGQTLAHAGEFIKDVGKVQEFNTQEDIKNSPELAAANSARDQNISAYENYYNQKVDDTQKSINAPNADLNLFPSDAQAKADRPVDLRTLPQLASTMGQAKLDTKINQVLLTAEVERNAKALRSRYPDHADFIDQTFRRAGFGNTANEKQQALQQFYLAANANKDEDKKSAIAYGRSHSDVPGVAEILSNIHLDVPGAVGLLERTVNRYESYKSGLKLSNDQLDTENKFSADEGRKNFGTFTMGAVNSGFQTMYDKSGYKNFNQIRQEVADTMRNSDNIDPVKIQKLGMQLHALRQQTSDYMTSVLFAPEAQERPPGFVGPMPPKTDQYGRMQSVATKLGPNGAADGKAMIDSALYPIDQVIQAIESKDWGLSSHIPHMVEAYTQKDIASIMANPTLRQHMTQLKAMVELNPQYGEKYFTANFPEGSTAIQAWIKDQKLSQIQSGTPIVDGFDALTKYKINPQAASELIDGVTDIYMPTKDGGLKSDDSKRNAAKAFFADANKGLLKYFPEDRWDKVGKDTVFIPGRLSIFKKMTDPRVTDEMKRLGPETWSMYKAWTEGEHDNNIFRGQLQTLNKLPDDFSRLDFGWNDKAGHFEVKVKPEQGKRLGQYRIPDQVKSLIDNVNNGLDSLNHIAEKDGVSPTVYTLQRLREFGFQSGDNFTGIPKELHDAVQNSTNFPVLHQKDIRPGETPERALARKRREEADKNKMPPVQVP